MKHFVIVQSDKEFYTSHSGLALAGLGLNKFCSLPVKVGEAFPLSPGSNGIGLDDILRSYLGVFATGQSDYEAVTNRREDDYFRESLGIRKVPSAETLRQRLDEVASGLRPHRDAGTVKFLKKAEVTITPLDTGHVPLDCPEGAASSGAGDRVGKLVDQTGSARKARDPALRGSWNE